MRKLTRRTLLAGFTFGVVGLSAGCDLATLSYFMTPEQRRPAKFQHLASADKKKPEPKVVILTYAKPAEVADFINADRQLAEMLGRNLTEFATASEERIALLPQRRVEEFKNSNPEWKRMPLASVGRRLGADYVIYLEINSLSMFEPRSNNLLRGRANLLVSLTDVSKPDDTPMQTDFSNTFPSAQGPVPVAIDTSPAQFRQQFLSHVARQLTYYFAMYPQSEMRLVEPVF